MVNEDIFSSVNPVKKIQDVSEKNDYSDQEIEEKLSKGKDLNRDFAIFLLEKGRWMDVATNLAWFEGLNQEVAIKLIEAGNSGPVSINLDFFEGLNQEVAFKLIESGQGESVLRNLDKFKNLNHKEIALKLIHEGKIKNFVNNLDKFQFLDQEIAQILYDSNYFCEISNYLDRFRDLDEQFILKLLKRVGGGVVNNFGMFPWLSHEKLALELIESGQDYVVLNNLDIIKLVPQSFYKAIREKYTDFIEEVEIKIPKLAEQLAKSVESLIDILAIKDDFHILEKTLNKSPFLSEALESNPRYGSKLVIKYQEFDETAKGNIKELFSIKKEILKENPEIDVDSAEFRELVQKKLSNYKNNPEVLKELENRGVNVGNWLNYDESIYFTFSEQEDVKFSDKIKTPITRIKETLNKYQESIVFVLSDYKRELQTAFIPSQESEELKQKIKYQEEKIILETDEKKSEGMKRGLISLKIKEESLKPVSVWSRVQSDIFRLKSMIENIFKFHDLCIINEAALETIKDRKELIKEKDKLEKNKIQFKENIKNFELFFESYEVKLQKLIAPSLGQERSDSLIQEMKEKIGEELNHYNTDKNTLNNIFEDENKNDNVLKDREMKITISSRSPKDLYLGNYCPCCICIDSEYHGAESPIADYVTDLGMQNIVVYDEKKNIPVLVAWTFIGEKNPKGKPIMVLDNIEANTEYTNQYPEKLKEMVEKFVANYARAANIDSVIQGPHNNDLEVFPLGEISNKLGDKYNRPYGYFLEAEIDED